MTDVAEMVRKLIDSGAEPGLAAEIVASAFVAGHLSTPYRSPGAEAAARYRDKIKASRDMTRHDGDDAKKGPPDPLKEITTPALSSKELTPKRRKPKLPLPDAYPFTDEHREVARAAGLRDGEGPREFEKFVSHARAHDRRCSDWMAAWRNWCVKAVEFKGREMPGPDGSPTLNGAPHHGDVLNGRVWFHMESPEYRQRGETRTDRYCGWWFPREAA